MNSRYLLFLFASIFCLIPASAFTQEAEPVVEPSVASFHGREIATFGEVSEVEPSQRVRILERRIKRLAGSPLFDTNSMKIYNDRKLGISLIMVNEEVLVSIWPEDAALQGTSVEALAEIWRENIREAINTYRADHTMESYIKGGIFAAIATILLLLFRFIVGRLVKREKRFVDKRFAGQKMLKFVDGDTVVAINGYAMSIVRLVAMLWALVVYLNVVLSFFPWTFNLSAKLFSLIRTPFLNFYYAFIDNLPNLFALLVIGAIVHVILRFLRHIFLQISEGRVRLKGFYRDWARPTYGLARMFIIVFALIMAFPFIPGSSSPAFKGISIFVGVLFSLGSTSAVGNIFAGMVLTYMRPFVNGDFVEISGIQGTVVTRGTFSTRLRTPTSQIVTISNGSVSGNHIINYSREAKRGGVKLGTSVTIGYDVPWRKVHELLLSSTEGIEGVEQDPAPRVLQISLDDFYVKYRLVVNTKKPENKAVLLSNLHEQIQDKFAEAGVEIMSPHYQDQRQTEGSTIPKLETGE